MAYYHQILVSRDYGGAAKIALHVADYLQRQEKSSRVWIPGEGPAFQQAAGLGLTSRSYDALGAQSPWKVRAAWSNWRLGRRMRLEPGLLHVHSPIMYGNLRWAFHFSGLRKIAHVHLEGPAEGFRWAFRDPPDLIITCAKFLLDPVQRALPAKAKTRVVAVSNAVDCARFQPGDKAAAKARFGLRPDLPMVLMLANLAPHKGQETAIRAVAVLKNVGADVTLWLAGAERDGANVFTKKLEDLIREVGVEDRVRLLGPRNDAPELLQAADFFLLPSTSEGLPLSILEAQACKVPVLAAPTAGIPEVVEDGTTGFLLAAADAEGYAHRIRQLLQSPSIAAGISQSAHERVLREHSWTTFCQRVHGQYEELLDGPRNSESDRRNRQIMKSAV